MWSCGFKCLSISSSASCDTVYRRTVDAAKAQAVDVMLRVANHRYLVGMVSRFPLETTLTVSGAHSHVSTSFIHL
jgi:hypothetical protein